MSLKRTLLSCFCVLLGGMFPACAFDFSYGNYLVVKDIKQRDKKLLLPVAQRKYRNIKVLSKDVYVFLRQCQTDCRLEVSKADFSVEDSRKALTREGMLLADVSFNGDLLLTFLVFKEKNGFSVKTPEKVVFTDKQLERQVQARLREVAKEIL